MKKVVLGFVLIFLMAILTTGHAEVKAGAVSVTPFIGGYLFQDEENLKNPVVYGLRFGSDLTRHWGFEGAFYYGASENKSLAGNPNVDLYSYGMEGLYHFMPEGRLVPFLAAGGGGTYLHGPGGQQQGHGGLRRRPEVLLDR